MTRTSDKKSRGDTVRNMTDEELAHWVYTIQCRLVTLNHALERPASEEDWLKYFRADAI